jgi:hypothetical protein
MVRIMDPLHATIEEFEAEDFTHIECHWPRCRVTRMRPMNWLPRILMGLSLAQLSERLRCAECGGGQMTKGHTKVNLTPPIPTETKQRRAYPMFWLFLGLFIFALFAGFVLALDWIDPQGSRLF